MGLRRRGLVQRILPPVSLVLATWSRDYEAGLMTTRYDGPAEGEAAHAGINHWGATFASARRHSAVDRLPSVLAGAPVLTVAAAVDLTGRSHQAVNLAMAQLVQARILRQTTAGRRNRAFEVPEVTAAFTNLERRLAVRLAIRVRPHPPDPCPHSPGPRLGIPDPAPLPARGWCG